MWTLSPSSVLRSSSRGAREQSVRSAAKDCYTTDTSPLPILEKSYDQTLRCPGPARSRHLVRQHACPCHRRVLWSLSGGNLVVLQLLCAGRLQLLQLDGPT